MLLSIPAKKGDTITIKLQSAEEIVATYVGDDADNLTVSKPTSLVPSGEGFAFAPWMMTASDENVNINKNHVTSWLKSQEEVAKIYVQTTTGLAMPG